MKLPAKIAIVGPESTGKSTLATNLSLHFKCGLVEEYAREYLDKLERPYIQSDLLEIARMQRENELQALKKEEKLLICDTNLLVIKIWSEVKYGTCHPQILEWMDLNSYAHTFLCDVDIPWEYDPQREHPHFRQQLFDIYQAELEAAGVSYSLVGGTRSHRLNFAIAQIKSRIFAKD